MVLLEALACNIPIISTDCKTGPREILDDEKYGLLVKIKDSEDLAKNMIKLAKNPTLLKKYSDESSQRVKTFDFDKIKDDWIALIESHINKNKN